MNNATEVAVPKRGRGKAIHLSRAERQAEFAAAADEARLSIPTAAVVIGRGESTVWALIAAGQLAAERISTRCTRVRAGELRRFLNAQAA